MSIDVLQRVFAVSYAVDLSLSVLFPLSLRQVSQVVSKAFLGAASGSGFRIINFPSDVHGRRILVRLLGPGLQVLPLLEVNSALPQQVIGHAQQFRVMGIG